jgi:hypothetical protein
MNQLFKQLTTTALVFTVTTSLASPAYLITHNRTRVESNAYVAGKPSPHPTPATLDGKVSWLAVRMTCFHHTDNNNQCQAVVKMATNTVNPIELGVVSLNVETGDITPKYLSANGYTLIVNGPGETTLIEN